MRKFWQYFATATALTFGATAASADTFGSFTELQNQLSAGKFVDAEQTATQILQDDPKSVLVDRVLTARAQARFEQGHVTDAVVDWLEAIKGADNGQRRATVLLEMAAAMDRLHLGDNACAAIRRAAEAAGADDSPMGQLALVRSRANGCPEFAGKDFDRLFSLPFVMRASTQGTGMDSIFGGVVAVRFPDSWSIDENSRATPDGVNLTSKNGDAVCGIRRIEGTAPIKGYLDAVSSEEFTRGRRPGGKLIGVNGREGRMGSARAVEIDFNDGARPGRLYVATHLGMTYSVLCLGLLPATRNDVRRAAETISASMRWQE